MKIDMPKFNLSNIPVDKLKERFSGSLVLVKGMLKQGMPQNQAASSAIIGVDIGTDSVKTVKIERDKNPCALLDYSVQKVKQKNYREALADALKKCRAGQEDLMVFSMSGQGVVSRYVELPFMDKGELESSMRFESEKYIPFPLAEVNWDYLVISEMKEKAKMNVLIAAAKNDLIDRKRSLAAELNLKLKVLDLDSLALANFYTEVAGKKHDCKCCAVINMGRTNCNMDILVNDRPFLSRDIFMGGDDFTRKISEVLELDLSQAEELKLKPQGKEEALWSAWEPVLNSLASEIRVSLDYFESRGDVSVEKVFITGGSSRLFDICSQLERCLAVKVEKLDYSGQLKLDSRLDPDSFKADSDLLAVAIGLALRIEK